MKLSKVWPKTDGAVAVSEIFFVSEIAAKPDEDEEDKSLKSDKGTAKRG